MSFVLNELQRLKKFVYVRRNDLQVSTKESGKV